MRTAVPHLLHVHSPLSLVHVKHRERERRWAEEPCPSLHDLRSAAERLSAAGVPSFTVNELHAEMLGNGDGWSRTTVRDLLLREVGEPGGSLERVRTGRYRLRSGEATPDAAGHVSEHVVEAMRRLAAEGRVVVTRREIEESLRAGGVEFSGRGVRDGLLRLQRLPVPVLERVPGHRYRLS